MLGAERESAVDLAAKGGYRVATYLFGLTAEIDQVACVDDQRRAVVFDTQPLHLLAVVGGDLRRSPHARARREYLEGVRAHCLGAVGGGEDAAGCREVHADPFRLWFWLQFQLRHILDGRLADAPLESS